MVYSETMTVSIDARNTLIRNRDDIKARLGVEMYFPRSGVRGGYQDMVLKGTTGTVPKAIREVNSILASWKEEYEAFKQRKRERRMASRKTTEAVVWPSLKLNKEKLRVVSNNMFDVLAVDEVTASNKEVEKESSVKPAKVKTAKLTGWAAMAAKPAQTQAKQTQAKQTQAKPTQAKPTQAKPTQANDGEAEQGLDRFVLKEYDAWPSVNGETDDNNVDERVYSSWKTMEGVSWGDEDAWADEDDLVDSVVNDPWDCRDF